MKKNFPFFILIVLAFLTRFLFLAYPPEVVFDEVHFGKFVSAYSSGQYYFDIHPPLGKLLIAGFYGIFGGNLNFDFNNIGEAFNAHSLFLLRFLPALFSSLLVVLVYKLILAIGLSRKSAFFGASLIILENSILVESKFILTDIFLIFFGLLSLYLFILAKKNQKGRNLLFALAGISAGLSFSVKWTGLLYLGIILFYSFIELMKNFAMKAFFKKALFFGLIPLLVYSFVFFVHFQMLPKSGPGDAFMSPAFQQSLVKNEMNGDAIKPYPFYKKLWELNRTMYSASAGLKATHPNSSYFYQWPFMQESIWYWNKKDSWATGNIYLFGNPIIWLLVLSSVLLGIILFFNDRFSRNASPFLNMFIFGFFLNLLPYLFITRVTFLYHYLPSLVFGILIAAILFEKIPAILKMKFVSEIQYWVLGLALISFLIFSPLTYGFLLSEKINSYYQKVIGIVN